MKRPITPFRNGGRDRQGRFAAGNPGGPGNPYVKRAAEIRTAMMDAVSDDDLRAIVRALVKKAKRGDTVAAREVLDRLIGKSLAAVQCEVVTVDDRRGMYGGYDTPAEAVAAIAEASRREQAEDAEQEQKATA
jgi:hypothetical protein